MLVNIFLPFRHNVLISATNMKVLVLRLNAKAVKHYDERSPNSLGTTAKALNP